VAQWSLEQDAPDSAGNLRFRIFPDGDPARWVFETNPNLPVEVQLDCAQLIAALLSDLLGI
jgi:hypothetical protein